MWCWAGFDHNKTRSKDDIQGKNKNARSQGGGLASRSDRGVQLMQNTLGEGKRLKTYPWGRQEALKMHLGTLKYPLQAGKIIEIAYFVSLPS